MCRTVHVRQDFRICSLKLYNQFKSLFLFSFVEGKEAGVEWTGFFLLITKLTHFCQCIYFPSLHVSSNPVLIIRRIELYNYIIWYMSLCVGNCLVCRSERTGIPGRCVNLVINKNYTEMHGQRNIKFWAGFI